MTIQRTILLMVVLLMAVGCKHQTREVDLIVDSKPDIKELQTMQRKQAIIPASMPEGVVYQQIDGVDVEILPEYRMGPGDVLEVVYHIQYVVEKETYKIEVQDRLNITFPFHPQFSTSVLVRSDGQISLPLVGDVMAAGRTSEQLNSLLRNAYGKYIRNPSLTVSLQEFNVKVDELKRAITTAPRGQSKIAPVAPDGRIALPIIGNIQASGFTLRELEKIINEKYSHYINNLQATLILEEIRHMNFYIFGEVGKPGVYALPSQANLLDVFALAEGFTPRANLAQVLVFRSDGLKEPIVFMVDAEAMLKQGYMLKELTIRPADIIYIPKDWLSEANDLIEKVFTKGIYGILPFQSNFSVSYTIEDVKLK